MKTAIALLAAVGLTAAAFGQITVSVSLDGLQEVPPNASTATGSGTFTLNADNTISFNISYSGLGTGATVAHIHGGVAVGDGLPGDNAGVLLDIAPFHVGGALAGNTSGQFLATNVTPSANLLTALGLGQAYFNVHTGGFPGGEIRGQISAVPEPSAAAALAGLAAAGALAGRRRRA